MTKIKVATIQLAEDVKNFIKFNEDVIVSESLMKKIESFNDYDLIKVVKEIHPLKIVELKA